nr:uncharacterized protein LOC112721634 [Arachis hypogaea]
MGEGRRRRGEEGRVGGVVAGGGAATVVAVRWWSWGQWRVEGSGVEGKMGRRRREGREGGSVWRGGWGVARRWWRFGGWGGEKRECRCNEKSRHIFCTLSKEPTVDTVVVEDAEVAVDSVGAASRYRIWNQRDGGGGDAAALGGGHGGGLVVGGGGVVVWGERGLWGREGEEEARRGGLGAWWPVGLEGSGVEGKMGRRKREGIEVGSVWRSGWGAARRWWRFGGWRGEKRDSRGGGGKLGRERG